MTIEKRTEVETATCDACGHIQCTDTDGEFNSGLELTVKDYKEGLIHNAWACKETHIRNAVRAVLARSRAQIKDEALWREAEAQWNEDRAKAKAARAAAAQDNRDLSNTPVTSER